MVFFLWHTQTRWPQGHNNQHRKNDFDGTLLRVPCSQGFHLFLLHYQDYIFMQHQSQLFTKIPFHLAQYFPVWCLDEVSFFGGLLSILKEYNMQKNETKLPRMFFYNTNEIVDLPQKLSRATSTNFSCLKMISSCSLERDSLISRECFFHSKRILSTFFEVLKLFSFLLKHNIFSCPYM